MESEEAKGMAVSKDPGDSSVIVIVPGNLPQLESLPRGILKVDSDMPRGGLREHPGRDYPHSAAVAMILRNSLVTENTAWYCS